MVSIYVGFNSNLIANALVGGGSEPIRSYISITAIQIVINLVILLLRHILLILGWIWIGQHEVLESQYIWDQ